MNTLSISCQEASVLLCLLLRVECKQFCSGSTHWWVNRKTIRHSVLRLTISDTYFFLFYILQVVICSFYLGHYIILASRYMSDYIPEVPVPDDFKLDNVPLIVIGFISTLILILRWLSWYNLIKRSTYTMKVWSLLIRMLKAHWIKKNVVTNAVGAMQSKSINIPSDWYYTLCCNCWSISILAANQFNCISPKCLFLIWIYSEKKQM